MIISSTSMVRRWLSPQRDSTSRTARRLYISLYYFLFSFGIIKFSFSFVSYFAAPALTIGCLVCFIAFYFLQKNHKELMLKDEDSENFSEEEFPDEDF